MEFTMHDTLLQLPLFQGMSKNDFVEVLNKVKLNFQKFKSGDTILEQNENCDQLVFLLSGEIMSETYSECGSFTYCEKISHPCIIEAYSLFGVNPHFKSSYSAMTEVSLLTIHKSFIYSELNKYETFRINLNNILSNRSQMLYEKIWNICPMELEGRIISFIKLLSDYPTGTKILKIKMDDLAKLLDDTRLNVSNVLNNWQEKGFILMRRKEFEIPDLARLQIDE